ncbi:MAG: hypothetical protein ACTSQI_05970 [Candidatus Helarchaeota archaeon]
MATELEFKAREGDLVETKDGLIFDVKGLIHPVARIIAYLRYYPDSQGDRIRGGIRYKKLYDLDERTKFLQKYYPEYLFNDEDSGISFQGVPKEKVVKIYRPNNFVTELLQQEKGGKIENISSVARKALELIKLIQKESSVKFENLGITGSCLVNLEIDQSDIDLMIYGLKAAYKVRNCMTKLYEAYPKRIQHYSRENISKLYKFRGKKANVPFEEFIKLEQRKKLQGIFEGTDYYIRCIKDWDELGNERVVFRPIGRSTLKAEVINADEAIFTPCKYLIRKIQIINGDKSFRAIREIVSFRGRFCEQTLKGEEIEARGTVEEVKKGGKKYLRLLIGTHKEDYLKVLNL